MGGGWRGRPRGGGQLGMGTSRTALAHPHKTCLLTQVFTSILAPTVRMFCNEVKHGDT